MSSIDNKALSEAAKNLDTAVEMLLEYNIELEALRAENRQLKIEIAVLTNTPTGQDIVAAYKRAEAENERLRTAICESLRHIDDFCIAKAEEVLEKALEVRE